MLQVCGTPFIGFRLLRRGSSAGCKGNNDQKRHKHGFQDDPPPNKLIGNLCPEVFTDCIRITEHQASGAYIRASLHLEAACAVAEFVAFVACSVLSPCQRLYCSALAGSGSS